MTRRPKPTTSVFPIRIVLGPVLPGELALAEEGSYEDQMALGVSRRDRPLHSHAHIVAQRYTGQLRVENIAEAEDMYYAVCSGTFKVKGRRYHRAAVKVANALRPVVQAHNPDLVEQWPEPQEEWQK